MRSAYLGSLVADAFAMPAHWYYDRDALDVDYPDLRDYRAPHAIHAGSILWRSHYEPLNYRGDILNEEARFWGQKGVHYHRSLLAGENTVNFKLARELYEQVCSNDGYDEDSWLELYIARMLTPNWHRDTYLEEYHRGFFTNYAKGRTPRKCGIVDEHIGGLAQVPALVAALPQLDRQVVRQKVRNHVSLTHSHDGVLRAADCLTRILLDLNDGMSLRESLVNSASDWFSTRKALGWEKRPDRTVVGEVFSPACYIEHAFPASIFLAWKYHDDFGAAIVANAGVGGDSCHRGAVVGSLVGLANPSQVEPWLTGLEEKDV